MDFENRPVAWGWFIMARPALQASLAGNSSGKVLIGTVQGDIHDIGKTIFEVALRSYGFTVEDLGVDVPPNVFAERAASWRPDIVGLSGLLSTAYDAMRETVQLLRASSDAAGKTPVPILIGGGFINDQVRAFVGADYWRRPVPAAHGRKTPRLARTSLIRVLQLPVTTRAP